MLVVPIYVLALLPAINIWWTHRRCDRREYLLLTSSFAVAFVLLLMLAQQRHLTATRYEGPLAATGIDTDQIPCALMMTTLITIIPIKWKLLRDLAALILGEAIILRHTWIS